MSGLGHGRGELGRALIEQQQRLDHVLYGGVAHEPAALLAGELIQLAGESCQREETSGLGGDHQCDDSADHHPDQRRLRSPKREGPYKDQQAETSGERSEHTDSENISSADHGGQEEPLSRVFYSDNGSTAVEIALKMAYSYTYRTRDVGPEPRFLAVSGGYHGDTLGAMSVSAQTRYHTPYEPLFAHTEYLQPYLTHGTESSSEPAISLNLLIAQLEERFRIHHQSYLGFICEPLLGGAGGMLMQHPAWLRAVVKLCRQWKVVVIFDEVFTAYGRLGYPFAFQKLGLVPDILCTSKGLTAGTLPLAVTLASEKIYGAFLSEKSQKALLHGHTFTAHPTACHVARKVLEIYLQEKLFSRALNMEKLYRRVLADLGVGDLLDGELDSQEGPGNRPGFQPINLRVLGSVLAFEVGDGYHNSRGDSDDGGEDHRTHAYFRPRAMAVARRAGELGLFVRPLGRTLYLAPPLSACDDELQEMTEILFRALKTVE